MGCKSLIVETQPHLIIDGYNVIHAWPELRGVMRGSQAAACERLIVEVRLIHDEDHCRVTVVFDGAGDKVEIDRPGGGQTFPVLYAPKGLSADGLIEQIVCNSANPERVTVVTGDRMIADAIVAAGALVQTPDDLAAWVRRCASSQELRLIKKQKKNNSDWKNNVLGDSFT